MLAVAYIARNAAQQDTGFFSSDAWPAVITAFAAVLVGVIAGLANAGIKRRERRKERANAQFSHSITAFFDVFEAFPAHAAGVVTGHYSSPTWAYRTQIARAMLHAPTASLDDLLERFLERLDEFATEADVLRSIELDENIADELRQASERRIKEIERLRQQQGRGAEPWMKLTVEDLGAAYVEGRIERQREQLPYDDGGADPLELREAAAVGFEDRIWDWFRWEVVPALRAYADNHEAFLVAPSSTSTDIPGRSSYRSD